MRKFRHQDESWNLARKKKQARWVAKLRRFEEISVDWVGCVIVLGYERWKHENRRNTFVAHFGKIHRVWGEIKHTKQNWWPGWGGCTLLENTWRNNWFLNSLANLNLELVIRIWTFVIGEWKMEGRSGRIWTTSYDFPLLASFSPGLFLFSVLPCNFQPHCIEKPPSLGNREWTRI
jgi:hypothetical protein